MRPVLNVINRCIVIEFYKQNAAFFGLILLVIFGFIKAQEHIAIGSFLIANPVALFYLYAIWLLYGIKVILFVLPAINKKENQFLESFFLLSFKLKITSTSLATFALFIPILGYSTFLILLSITQGYYLSVISLISSLFIILSVSSFLLIRKLNNLPHEKTYFQFSLFKKKSLPPFLFFFEHLIRKEIVLLILTKIYVCTLVIGTSILYRTDNFDLRVLTTGVLFALFGNVTLVYKYAWFHFKQMVFFKNLPQSFLQLLIRQSITFAILSLPEFIVLFRHYPIEPHFLDMAGILLFGFSIYYLIYGVLLIKPVELSELMIPIFWIVILTTFIILFSIHPLILGMLYIFISIVIIYFRHDQFEYSE